MENFIYQIPTKVFFGKGQIKNLGKAIQTLGGSRVLLGYGGGSIKKNGIHKAVIDQLKNRGLKYVELSGIQPNPRLESVEQGIALYRENDCDFILAVGGGSTLDACKAIAAGTTYDGPVIDLLTGKAAPKNAAPLGTILTMAGTGSELDQATVITAGEDHKKLVIKHPELFPRFSILDPEYTFSVPVHHTMAGCADILCHLMEQYLTPDNGARVQDRMNEGLMKVVMEYTPKVQADPENYEARANIMWASSQALGGFQFVLGKPPFRFPLHTIGHELSSLYDMTHGVTLALLTPAWMRHTMRTAPDSTAIFARFARNVLDVRDANDAAAAETGVGKLEAFYAAIGMPENLAKAGVEEDKLRYLAEKAVEGGNLGCLNTIGADEAYEILRQAY